MSAIMDPAKLKVVELRAELASRSLDTKGNKPVLVKRLREALEAESGNELPDTSIGDTSTEENTSTLSLSQSSPPEPEAVAKEPEREATPEPEIKPVESPPKSRSRTRRSDESREKPKVAEPEPEPEPEPVVQEPEKDKMDTSIPEEKPVEEPTPVEEVAEAPIVATEEDKAPKQVEEKAQSPVPEEEKESSDMETSSAAAPAAAEDTKMDEEQPQEQEDVEMAEDDSKAAGDSLQDSVEAEKESAEPRNRKSRWGSVTEAAEPTDSGGVPDDNSASGDATTPSTEQPRGEKRRNGSPSPERVARKRSRSPIREDEPDMDCNETQLSWIDSDLNLQVNKEGFTVAEPMHSDGFGYMWAGVRATHGINNGKARYEVKLLENCDWKEAPREDKKKDKNKDKDKETEKSEDENKETEKEEAPAPVEPIHVFRVGWSLPNTDLQLGEQPHSYAYDSEGLSATDSQFTEFGVQYGAGDVVGAFLDMTTDSITISYTVNGELQPTAFTVDRSELPEDSTLFPHILTRNIKFEVNFGQKEEPWFQSPEEFADFTFVKDVETKVAGFSRPAERKECEVVMMVGLPCSGKTQWVNNHVTSNPDKKYNVLGLGVVLDKMKYRGKSRKENFKGSVTVLMDKTMRCLSKLIDVASSRRRNFIIDQTNLFSSAQRRKLRPFDGFRRQAVVIVVADDEQSSREKSRQQADGKDVPDSAVLEMKANMCLPTVCDWLDEVTYAELDEEKSKEMVQKYNKQGREAGYGPNYTAKQRSNNQKQQGGNDRRGSWGRNNQRDNGRDNRNNRWGGSGGGGGGGGGGHNRQNNWGGANRGSGGWGGRHDSRNHHHGGGGGRGGEYRNNSNNRMMSGGGGGGGGYNNRNQGAGGGGGGYNRNRNQPPHRNQMQNKGGNWGGPGGAGGNWNSQGSWGNQGGWGGHQSGGQGGGSGSGWNQGSWGQYGNNQGGQGGGNQQWKGGYNAQQYQQQGYTPGYAAGQYGQGQYPNWNYYGQYAQGWNAQQQGQQSGTGSSSDSTSNTAQYNQYTQQQQAAWAQYAQSGYGGYGQAASQGGSGGGNAITGSAATQPASATKQ